jgi:hypothetical protein
VEAGGDESCCMYEVLRTPGQIRHFKHFMRHPHPIYPTPKSPTQNDRVLRAQGTIGQDSIEPHELSLVLLECIWRHFTFCFSIVAIPQMQLNHLSAACHFQ